MTVQDNVSESFPFVKFSPYGAFRDMLLRTVLTSTKRYCSTLPVGGVPQTAKELSIRMAKLQKTNQAQKALELFQQGISTCPDPDTILYSHGIKAARQLQKGLVVEQIAEDMQARGVPMNKHSAIDLIDTFTNNQDYAKALEILKQAKDSGVDLGSITKSMSRLVMLAAAGEDVNTALETLSFMRENGFVADGSSYYRVLSNLNGTHNDRKKVRKLTDSLYKEMRENGVRFNSEIVVALIRNWKSPSKALQLVQDELKILGVELDIDICTQLLNCLAQEDEWEKILVLGHYMPCHGIAHTSETLTILLQAVARKYSLSDATAFLRTRIAQDADEQTFAMFVMILLENKEWLKAVDVLLEMENNGMILDSEPVFRVVRFVMAEPSLQEQWNDKNLVFSEDPSLNHRSRKCLIELRRLHELHSKSQ